MRNLGLRIPLNRGQEHNRDVMNIARREPLAGAIALLCELGAREVQARAGVKGRALTPKFEAKPGDMPTVPNSSRLGAFEDSTESRDEAQSAASGASGKRSKAEGSGRTKVT